MIIIFLTKLYLTKRISLHWKTVDKVTFSKRDRKTQDKIEITSKHTGIHFFLRRRRFKNYLHDCYLS